MTEDKGDITVNWDLTSEQQLIQKTIREFAEEVVAKGSIERDQTKAFPKEIFQQLAELGMLGLPFPEKYGGAGSDTISFAIVVEELSKACELEYELFLLGQQLHV